MKETRENSISTSAGVYHNSLTAGNRCRGQCKRRQRSFHACARALTPILFTLIYIFRPWPRAWPGLLSAKSSRNVVLLKAGQTPLYLSLWLIWRTVQKFLWARKHVRLLPFFSKRKEESLCRLTCGSKFR